MQRHKVLLVILLAIALVVGGCGSSDSSMEPGAPDFDNRERDDYADAPSEGEEQGPRHRIYQGSLRIKVEDTDTAVKELSQRAESLGGYIEDSQQWDSTSPSAFLVLRVPQEHFHTLFAYAESLGEPTNQNKSTTDVSEEYRDLEARMRSRVAHEERLLELFGRAQTIEDLLKIEAELARVRSEIESLEGRIRSLDQQISMSRIEISLRQAEETDIPPLSPMGFDETVRRAGRALSQSITLFLNLISYLFILIIAALPILLPLALILLVWSRFRKRKVESTKPDDIQD